MGQIYVQGIGLVEIAGDTPTAAESNAIAQAQTAKTPLGGVKGFGLSAVQGATFEFGDELYGMAAGVIPGGQNREEATQAYRDAYERVPTGTKIAGNLAGGLATAFVPGLGQANAARVGATAAGQIGRAALTGAGQGALAGFGAGEGGIVDRAGSAIQGGLTGAALGGAAQATLGRIARPRAAQTAPGAAAADELGIPLTRGQRTGDVEQLSREAELVGTRSAGGDIVRDFYEQSQDPAIQRAVQQTGAKAGSTDSLQNAANDALGAFRAAERGGKQAYKDAYDKLATLRGEITDNAAFADLRNRFSVVIDNDIDGFGLDPEIGQWMNSVADELTSRVKQGMPTIQRMEGMRKALNGMYGRQKDPARRAGVSAMIEQFDDWLGDTITKGLYRGDPAVVDSLKNARSLYSQYQRVFGIGGRDPADRAAGRMVQKLIDDQAGPDEAMNFIFGLQNLGAPGAKRALARIQTVSPEAFTHVKAAHYQSLITDKRSGAQLTPNQIASNIDRLLARQPDMARIIYGQDNVKALAKLSAGLRVTDRNIRGAGNASRSGYTITNALKQFGRLAGIAGGLTIDPAIGFATLLTEGFANLGANRTARAAVSQTLPAAGGGIPGAIARNTTAQIGRISPSLNSSEPFGSEQQ